VENAYLSVFECESHWLFIDVAATLRELIGIELQTTRNCNMVKASRKNNKVNKGLSSYIDGGGFQHTLLLFISVYSKLV
jgi:hypothetical protein